MKGKLLILGNIEILLKNKTGKKNNDAKTNRQKIINSIFLYSLRIFPFVHDKPQKSMAIKSDKYNLKYFSFLYNLKKNYIRKTGKFISFIGEFFIIFKFWINIFLVLIGFIIPSSHKRALA